MPRTDKYSQHSLVISPVWLNGSVFVYELRGCDFKSRCCQLPSITSLDLMPVFINLL